MEDDLIKKPKHYLMLDNVESIEIIASALTTAQWKGFCLGNILKYRIRAGKKDDMQQDIAKSIEYEDIFHRYTHLNRTEDTQHENLRSRRRK